MTDSNDTNVAAADEAEVEGQSYKMVGPADEVAANDEAEVEGQAHRIGPVDEVAATDESEPEVEGRGRFSGL